LEIAESTRVCPNCGSPLDSPEDIPTATASKAMTHLRDSGSQAAFRLVPGVVLARRYRIVSLLGTGGMGRVYRAEDLRLGVTVALKFLPEELATHPEWLARLRNEVRVARRVTHPNVCRVHDIVEAEGQHFLSMDHVDGENLASLLRRIGRVTPDRGLRMARQISAGLAAAHERGVLHRDLKPANIMIDGRGHAVIMDFGLAIPEADPAARDARAGTPPYMSPERLAGEAASAASDLYALGLVLFEIFTGERLFTAASLAELKEQQARKPSPSLRATVPGIDPAVDRVVRGCLEARVADRPGSARQVLQLLPGGDPLDAAVAAGETPSPEMVAASAEVGALHPIVAWMCLGVAVGLLAFNVTRGNLPLPKHPAVLAERARQIQAQAGYQDKPLGQAYGFLRDWTCGSWKRRRSATARDGAAVAEPSCERFWFRQSPRPLVAHADVGGLPWMVGIRPVGVVTRTNPPLDWSGMTEVILDATGRLISLTAVPPQVEASCEPCPEQDWKTLFEEAGLSLSEFEPTGPRWAARVDSDRKAAWLGTYPLRPDIPLRVEAAAYHGRPVFFEVQGPWVEADRMGPAIQWTIPTLQAALWSYVIVIVFALAGGVFLVRRNLQCGRGDRKGAFRLGVFVALSLGIAEMLRADHVPRVFEEYHLIERVLTQTLAWALLVSFGYLALEPLVRRRWPRTLATWHRVLAGRFGDPMIGRDALVGTVAGFCGLLAFTPPESPKARYEVAVDARQLVHYILATPFNAIAFGAGTLLLILLLWLVVKRRWLAMILVGSLLIWPALGTGSTLARDVPLAVLFAAGWILIVVRLGLFAAVATWFSWAVAGILPPFTSTSIWYAGVSVAGVAILLTLLLWAFYTSLGGRSVLAWNVDG
jgi:hypothetical protein